MLLERVEDAEGALAMAKREMKEEFLERAIAMCDEFKYNAATVKEARALLKGIIKVRDDHFFCWQLHQSPSRPAFFSFQHDQRP
jgi:hypothetical protein